MKITIIGAGIAGLAAAGILAKSGFEVLVLEKNKDLGGRARCFKEDGFFFDMGPSWYWMPDIFERFYTIFGKTSQDFYQLSRLNPAYRVFWQDNTILDIPDNEEDICLTLEKIEQGSYSKIKNFLHQGKIKYQIGMQDFVYKPCLSISEFLSLNMLKKAFQIDLFQSMDRHIRKFVKDENLIQLLSFPTLFLGASPKTTPALYSLMNYADFSLGTWYPQGGMNKIIEAFTQIAKSQGVTFKTNSPVKSFTIKNKNISALQTDSEYIETDLVVGTADYHHIEENILEPKYRSYSNKYWQKRAMSPSCFIYYLGINKKIEALKHHNLFFDSSFDAHAESLYKTFTFPKNPLFYVSCTSKSDQTAPKGCENLFILIPIAAGLKDTSELRNYYFDLVIKRLEKKTKTSIKSHIIFKKSYAPSNFIKDYNAFKGNAYGLANTLKQTAFLKPRIKSKKINNLYYAGQLTVPGPGLPPAVISGEIVAKYIIKKTKTL